MVSRLPSAIIIVLLLITAYAAHSVAPPANTIPIISHRTGLDASCENITMEVLLNILEHNIDGILIGGKFTQGNNYISEPLTLADSAGAVVILNAFRFGAMSFWPSLRWGRYTPAALSSANAFIHPDSSYDSIDRQYKNSTADGLFRRRCLPQLQPCGTFQETGGYRGSLDEQ